MSTSGTSVAQPGGDKLPRGAILGAGVLVISSLLIVAVARMAGYAPAKPPLSAIVESSEVRFEDRADGAVLIFDTSRTGTQPAMTLQPGTNGFVRGVLRGLVRERRADRIGPTPPFKLTHWADGRLSLDDPSTGRHVDLEVFGPTNAGAFADILTATAHHKD